MKEGREQLGRRTLAFSQSIIRFVRKQERNFLNQNIFHQLLKSATSIGANVEEANAAISQADFLNKLYIARKEARETLYWLRLLEELTPHQERGKLQELTEEARAIELILRRITFSLRKRRDV